MGAKGERSGKIRRRAGTPCSPGLEGALRLRPGLAYSGICNRDHTSAKPSDGNAFSQNENGVNSLSHRERAGVRGFPMDLYRLIHPWKPSGRVGVGVSMASSMGTVFQRFI